VNCPDFVVTITILLFSYLCKIKLKVCLVDIICRILLTFFWFSPHLNLSGAPCLSLLHPFLTSGPDLGAWSDCWAFVEFLHAPIPRKGSGITTTKIDCTHKYCFIKTENSLYSRMILEVNLKVKTKDSCIL